MQYILWIGYGVWMIWDHWRTRNYRKTIARLETECEYRRKELEEMKREIIELQYHIKRA